MLHSLHDITNQENYDQGQFDFKVTNLSFLLVQLLPFRIFLICNSGPQWSRNQINCNRPFPISSARSTGDDPETE